MIPEAAQLKHLIGSSSAKAKVLAVTSGKGGVGKSNISSNLAICLAASQKRVLLMDADFSLGNLDVLMNIHSKYNIWHMLNGNKSLEDIIHIGPADVKLVCGASGIEELANLTPFHQKRLVTELGKLQQDNDTIIIDTAAGISKSVVGFCLAADQTLVVTTPEASAMTDAYAMIKVLAAHNYTGKISLLVNMACSLAEGRKVYQQMANVSKQFLDIVIYDAGIIKKTDHIVAAVKKRKPVVLAYPKAPVTKSFVALASKLGSSWALQQDETGFLNKIVNWFF